MTTPTMDSLPLWFLFLLTVATVLVGAGSGYRMGLLRKKRSPSSSVEPVGAVIGAVLGLLAFLLAFTFSSASDRFNTRRQLLLDEVNAIGTAALRAELLPEPHRAQCHELLKRYVDLRAGVFLDSGKASRVFDASEALQNQLWSHAVALARADINSHIGGLFVESLNAVFDLHTARATIALQYRIPLTIWMVLFALAALSMAGVGYHFGLSGRMSRSVLFILSISFSIVVLVIADLDRPSEGMLTVSQQPMLDLQQKLSRPPTPAASP